MIRPLFLSHGAPTLLLEDTPARSFLAGLAAAMERPQAILAVSAHWETRVPCVNAVATNATIHDFYGFPPALHALAYPAPGDPALAEHVAELIGAAGLPVAVDPRRGLDHGAWVPLMLAWPEADIPVPERRTCDLLSWRNLAPHADRNHPTDEHLLPLFVALGAAGPHATATRLHASTTYGVLRMDAYAFDNQLNLPSFERIEQ